MPEEVTLELTIPPELGDRETLLAEVRRRVAIVEAEEALRRARTGKRVLGRYAILRQSWRDSPRGREPRRNLRPTFAARSLWARLEAIQRKRDFAARVSQSAPGAARRRSDSVSVRHVRAAPLHGRRSRRSRKFELIASRTWRVPSGKRRRGVVRHRVVRRGRARRPSRLPLGSSLARSATTVRRRHGDADRPLAFDPVVLELLVERRAIDLEDRGGLRLVAVRSRRARRGCLPSRARAATRARRGAGVGAAAGGACRIDRSIGG